MDIFKKNNYFNNTAIAADSNQLMYKSHIQVSETIM